MFSHRELRDCCGEILVKLVDSVLLSQVHEQFPSCNLILLSLVKRLLSIYCCLETKVYAQKIIILLLCEVDIEVVMSLDAASYLKNDN